MPKRLLSILILFIVINMCVAEYYFYWRKVEALETIKNEKKTRRAYNRHCFFSPLNCVAIINWGRGKEIDINKLEPPVVFWFMRSSLLAQTHWAKALILLLISVNKINGETIGTSKNVNEKQGPSFSFVDFKWDHVEISMMISFWLITACVARICFHINKKFGEIFPDSALLIIVGFGLGFFLKWVKVGNDLYNLDANIFFLYLLPPIIFDGGYFMPTRQFFDNIGSIAMFAFVGTFFNTVCIGFTLAICSSYGLFSVSISYVEAFIFASLISATDPVAVIAVFEEINVNEFLFINVFAESIFNDGVAASFFIIFNKMLDIDTQKLNLASYAAFGGTFVVVAFGAILVGILMALVCAISTKFSGRVKIVPPVFIFVIPCVSYLIAELFGLSSILTICVCGIVVKQYVKFNISHKAALVVKYFIKILAQSSETVVFMFLGLSTVSDMPKFDILFCVVTVVACLIYRAIGVIIQCAILNRFKAKKYTYKDQFVLAYGGLRGAIAFGLLASVPNSVHGKEMFAGATIVVICFTVFVQGSTIRPILNWLKIENADDQLPKMIESVNLKQIDYTKSAIQDIVDQNNHSISRWFKKFNSKTLKPLLIKNTKGDVYDASQIVRAHHKITLQESMELVRAKKNKPGINGVSPNVKEGTSNPMEIENRYKTMLDELFLLEQTNHKNLHAILTHLLNQKLSEYTENDDIKDDYISEVKSHKIS